VGGGPRRKDRHTCRAKTRAGHPCLARVELCISPPHQSGEQGKKHQKNAGGKNNSPQVWNVPGDPCPKDRPAAERQQDVQESDDDNLNILRDWHWHADLSWSVQYAQSGSIRLRLAVKKASCPLTRPQACATQPAERSARFRAMRIVLSSPNWGVGRGGNSRPYSEQFRSAHKTRWPPYGRLSMR
jgi:hypothetical protein